MTESSGPSKVAYRTLDGGRSTAYLDGPRDAETLAYWGEDKYTDARVLVAWRPDLDCWLQVAEPEIT